MSRQFSSRVALAVVVANMIGTGVFTSLGYQLADIDSGFAILALWAIGGVTALCGALSYAEMGAAVPRSGGEYHFLSFVYHPGAGFISGWVSATVGFAAPVALVAMTFGAYLQAVFPGFPQTIAACVLIAALALGHMRSHEASSRVQWVFTLIKLVLILVFCIATFALVPQGQPIRFAPAASDLAVMGSAGFAVALIYVNYAYTGWNAATYITGELEDPQRSLPRVLAVGTGVVMVIYVLLNAAFLYAAPAAEMVGKIEIGYIAGQYVFGPQGAKIMAVALALLLISSVSAMTLAGPRVLQVIGQDHQIMSVLAKLNGNGIPAIAIALQSIIAIAFVITATFQSILVFTGFVLGLNTLFAVFGVILLRWRQPDLPRPFRVPLYPLPPIIYCSVMLWTLVHILRERPIEGWLGLGIVLVGAVAYGLSVVLSRRGASPSAH